MINYFTTSGENHGTTTTPRKPETEVQPGATEDSASVQAAPEEGIEEPAGTDGAAPDAAPEIVELTPVADTDVSALSNFLDSTKEIFAKIGYQIWDWLTSPAFLVMVATVLLGYYFARLITKNLTKRIDFLREEPKTGKAIRLKKMAWQLRDLVFPAVLIALYAVASPALQSIPILGQNWLVKMAQGLAVVFLLYTAIKRFIKHPLVEKIVIWIAIPIAVFKVFGWYDEFQIFMQEDARLELGNISIPAWTIANILVFGSILFWIGRISNTKGKEVIQKQESIDAGTREVFSKIFEMVLFGILFILLMNIAGINLGALVVLGGAIGLGLGFGLQQIAANFISGMILLLDRTLKIGDYVLLPDGRP